MLYVCTLILCFTLRAVCYGVLPVPAVGRVPFAYVCMYVPRPPASAYELRGRSVRAPRLAPFVACTYTHAFATTYESHASHTIDTHSRLQTHIYIYTSNPSHHHPLPPTHSPTTPAYAPHPIHAPFSPPPPPRLLLPKTHIPISISTHPHASPHPNSSSKKHVLSTSSHGSPPRMARHRSRRPRWVGEKTLG